MKQKFAILSVIILTQFCASCVFSPSISGNGKVVTQERNPGEFKAIKVSRGMNVYISQGPQTNVRVEADENLLPVIETELEGNVLKISADRNIRHAKSKKVFITTPGLDRITASAGSNVYTETTLQSEELEVSASAGSNIKLEVNARSIHASASAGSNIRLGGKSKSLVARASSGSNIKAEDLSTADSEASVSSGANIWVSVKNKLKGSASSGGNVFYYGNPGTTDINRSSGGNVIKKSH